ncbi:SPOR domain-containing protein [Pontibacillus marinus]|uniref:SPOR domain-containing protein n=1 Tax=Pontibacillus marinus BH030004 = DSM 16465 TaxID=1385511 RepID=A0A0A5G4N4_9BACI|nr:SPOR domain-containing protein [Pontibacillus marinus]KGX88076.1 hypothetical protein N783_08785 [Pontibacillus marinus BH030004 = DSM 16465]
MDKGNKISVRINGEDTYLDRKEGSEAQKEVQLAQDEQASAIEDWMEEQEKQKKNASNDHDSNSNDISVLERTYPVKNNRFGVPKTIKRMIMAGASAVLIGVALGYMMLRIFAGMESPEASSSTAYQDDVTQQEAASGKETTNEDSSTKGEAVTDKGNGGQAVAASKTTMTFPTVSAFVVQAGIFSTKEKAEIMQSAIATKGFKTYVWPRDGQFYLFAGVAGSKAEAEEMATLLKAQEVEVYVKDWNVSGTEKNVAQPEGKWVQTGANEWQTLLSPAASLIISGSGDAGALAKPMNSLKSSIPENITEQAAPLQQSYNQYLSAVQSYQTNQTIANLWAIQVSLLGVWYGYEQYVQ